MSKSPDEGRFVRHPSTIDEYLRQFPDPDPLQLAHLAGDELERALIRFSLLALTPSASGPETTVRVDSAVDPSRDGTTATMSGRSIFGSLPDRFTTKVEVDESTGCWNWTAALFTKGYGNYWDGKAGVRAHRFAYETLVGKIPDHLVIDHLCRNRRCVNPAHLEPVTNAENNRRGDCGGRTQCKHGHEYTPENTYIDPRGWRKCRICMRDASQRHSASLRTLTSPLVSGSVFSSALPERGAPPA